MKLFGFLLLASVLLSCVRNVSEESVDGREICFSSNIQEFKFGDLSRVDGFTEEDNVILYIVERENAGEVMAPKPGDRCEMRYKADGSLVFTDKLEHNYPDMPIDVYGYYWRGGQVEPGTLSGMEVRVETDQSAGLDNSDFLYVRAAEGYAKDAKPIELKFEHRFAKIVLNVVTETPTTIDLKRLVDMKLLDVVTIGTIDLGTGELANGEDKEDIGMPVSINSSVIILPQEIEDNKMLFSLQFEGMEELTEVEVSANSFEKGKIYTYNVKVNQYPGMGPVKVQFSLSVTDWGAGNTTDIVLEKGEDVEVELTDIEPGVDITKADLYLSSGEKVREVKNIVVKGNKMKFVFPRFEEGQGLQLDRAVFYTGDEESFVYYFEDMELKGNNYDKVVLPAPKVGDAWAGGTIFLVGEVTGYDDGAGEFKTDTKGINAYRGRVVANESLGNLMWCKDKIPVGATDMNDGNKNLETIQRYIEEHSTTLEIFPAFKACVELGTGWYYPAINEMKYIIAHKENLGEGVNLGSKAYGSSTERGVDNLCVGTNANKDSPVEVRPVCAY